ncbi:MAG TPA: hypothetical protein VK165_09855 [Azonexus sp.]|nr:hypothetical protein [Azonexus sp.]
MGFSISWLAVSGKEKEIVLKELGLSSTGEREELPESPVVSAELPNGWFLVFANRADSKLVANETLRALSSNCVVVACQVEEHIMVSSATCYTNEVNTWRVTHDAEQGIFHLEASGDLPSEFKPISDSLKAQQQEADGVDYIHDIPITLAQHITSFRHDEDISGASEQPFEVLTYSRKAPTAPSVAQPSPPTAQPKAAPPAKPWWKIW